MEHCNTTISRKGLIKDSDSFSDVINLPLVIGYVPQSFKLVVVKPLLKKPTLDAGILANCRPISNLPFLSKIFEKAIASQLCHAPA